jgi:aspartyl-tRNA(Asn)/glutamyl-tRNA(Gln) amidotransferase subunit A
MKKIYLDDMILTKDLPTTAGSRMLEGYMSPFDATVVEKLTAAGYEIAGKAPVGEFAIDLVGESCYAGAVDTVAPLKDADALIAFDVNGAPRRVAAQNGLVFVKPTYGTVSRFGTVPVACSGECVGVTAKSADVCRELLSAMAGKDERDGTMHADDLCKNAANAQKAIKKVAVLQLDAEADVAAAMEAAKAEMAANGIEICEVDAGVIAAASTAWNILMCAELCNNVSRYDGIKYGYRTKNYKNLDELYTNSRSEAFGDLLKTAILYGSDVLSTKQYMAKYDKALRVRRVIVEAFAALFADFDAVLMPACSKFAYTGADSAFEENRYTAPASITGLPAVVAGGVQLIGPAFQDGALLSLAEILVKEGK